MRLHLYLPGLLALATSTTYADDTSQLPLSDAYTCEEPPYKVHLISTSPLLLYITDFLTPSERTHLQAATAGTFSASSVTGPSSRNSRIRTSRSTTVPPRDPVARCVSARALSIQGFSHPRSHLEPLQLVEYGVGEHFHFHTDWFSSPAHTAPAYGGNRLSSFFAYVKVENGTTGGGTNFPMVEASAVDERWCELGYVDCDGEWDKGVTFRPVEGNAVFWRNLLEDGRGDDRTLHAGLPVTSGGKIGMNIWTRQGPVSEEIRGRDV